MGVSLIFCTQSKPTVRNSSGGGPLSSSELATETDESGPTQFELAGHPQESRRHVTEGLRHGVVSLHPRYPFNIAPRSRSSSSPGALQPSPPAIPHWEQRIYPFETGGVPEPVLLRSSQL